MKNTYIFLVTTLINCSLKMYKYIYNIYGHSLYIDKTDPQNDSLDLTVNRRNDAITIEQDTEDIPTTITERLQYLLYFLYNAFIISAISWTLIYTIIYTIKYNTRQKIQTEIFQSVFVIQYIIGLWYFNIPQFHKNIRNDGDTKKLFSNTSIISLICVILISLTTILLVVYKEQINESSILYSFESDSGFMIFLLVINRFYSYAAFFANMNLFFVQMHINKNKIDSYTERTKEYISTTYSLTEKVTTITKEFLAIKDNYDNIINDLNLFFASLSIIGIISLYFTIMSIILSNVDSIEIINGILFIITELLYINTAQNLRSSINEISNSIKSGISLDGWPQQNQQTEMNIINDPDYDKRSIDDNILRIKEMGTAAYICCKGIEENMMWRKLQETLKNEWSTFQFFGIKIKDTALLQKIFGFIIAIIVTSNIASALNSSN
jgi:hypothetical protein